MKENGKLLRESLAGVRRDMTDAEALNLWPAAQKDLQSGRQRSHAENDRSDASLFSFKLTIDFPMWRGYNSANNEIPMKPLRQRSTLTKPGVRELPAV